MELNIVSNDKIIFSSYQDDLMSCYPKEYIKWVAGQLNCDESDLRLLAVHPDFEEQDEEGWGVDSFFPANTEFEQCEIIHSDFEKETLKFEKFAIGEVIKIQVNGKTLIADYNASPCTVWINKQDIW